MVGTKPRVAEFALPLASLAAIRASLAETLGADDAARALQRAGYAAGEALFEVLARSGGAREEDEDGAGAVRELDEDTFWQRFRELFASRGWGRLSVTQPHAGVGALESEDWAEATVAGAARRPACFLSSGALASLLGRAAGEPVAVLEVECRARGDARCRFLFGNSDTLAAVHRDMGAGADADAVLAAL